MTEKENNEVLSDLHVFIHHEVIEDSQGVKRAVSRFVFKLPEGLASYDDEDTESDKEGTDSDGDLNVQRKVKTDVSTEAVTIYHCLETTLEDVGLQVWTGCLVLCDYILYYNHVFQDKTILDLGAGVGLTSIITAKFSSLVYCTDYSEEILNIAKDNIELNSHLLQNKNERHQIERRQVNWMDCEKDKTIKNLSDEEIKDLDMIIAAEVIYDIDLTTALFNTLSIILELNPCLTILISLEKRINFSVSDVDLISPAYSHFLECLEIMKVNQAERMVIEYSQITCDFPQYFCYSRRKELEIWKLTSIPIPNG